ncbi:MAG: thiosulfate sulfurtransferase, rhodanese [Proteobacteria bacterium]|nr:thiosulfate sulfurtransferase, rhodanese [Pseudomonadota bacterium]
MSMMENRKPGALVDPAWVAAHRDDPGVCLIEIAGLGQDELQAYRAGHVPGAHGWKWKDMLWEAPIRDFPSPQEFARRLGAAGIDNSTTVVFYGEGVQFGIYAWWVFRYCGHENVRVLDGARYRWAEEGRPLVTDIPPLRPPRTYVPTQRVEEMRIRRDDVLKSLHQPGIVLLDGRSPEEYRGERVGAPGTHDSGAMCYGRIPGARHVFFENLLTANKSLKSRDELKAAFDRCGADPDKDIITYCRLSHRATVLYFALTEILGRDRVKVYDGSWTEWGNVVGLPVER